MPRYAFCIALACIFGACTFDREMKQSNIKATTNSSNQGCVCPKLNMEIEAPPPNEYVCNNSTFDWMIQILVTRIAQMNDVLQQKEEHIIEMTQTWEEQREIYKEYLQELQVKHDEELNELKAFHARVNIKPHDCADIHDYGYQYSGIYTIYPTYIYRSPIHHPSISPMHRDQTELTGTDVVCQMNSDGGGWLVIQRRQDGSESFEKTWDEYKHGFGTLATEFWLGNDKIHTITQQRNYILRIDMTHFNDSAFYAEYDHFDLESEEENYKLRIGTYSGNAGDAMAYHSNQQFSTVDRDHDVSNSGNCAQLYGGGGWWFASCYDSNLNGKYTTDPGKHGIIWYPLDFKHHSLRTVTMKIRPKARNE